MSVGIPKNGLKRQIWAFLPTDTRIEKLWQGGLLVKFEGGFCKALFMEGLCFFIAVLTAKQSRSFLFSAIRFGCECLRLPATRKTVLVSLPAWINGLALVSCLF